MCGLLKEEEVRRVEGLDSVGGLEDKKEWEVRKVGKDWELWKFGRFGKFGSLGSLGVWEVWEFGVIGD